jgi:hypothetical protein
MAASGGSGSRAGRGEGASPTSGGAGGFRSRDATSGAVAAGASGSHSLQTAGSGYGGSIGGGIGSGGGEEASEWIKLLSILLTGALRVATTLAGGTSVLVHCSDGWDRTAQLTSLAQLLIDPYARTLDGFAVLVEKEWTAFGHRFATRTGTGGSGHDRGDHKDGQRSPVFLQWLDAVWQLWRQCPGHFQFSERLLVALADHAYAGCFGTFLFDCERERVAHGVYTGTESLWAVVLRSRHLRPAFINGAYTEGYGTPHSALEEAQTAAAAAAAVGGGVAGGAVLAAGGNGGGSALAVPGAGPSTGTSGGSPRMAGSAAASTSGGGGGNSGGSGALASPVMRARSSIVGAPAPPSPRGALAADGAAGAAGSGGGAALQPPASGLPTLVGTLPMPRLRLHPDVVLPVATDVAALAVWPFWIARWT